MKLYPSDSISGILANKVVGHENQHATMITVGSTGMGKSWANLEICYNIGLKFAEQLGGAWNDYFDYKNNIVIADMKQALSTIKRMKKPYQITLFDDIGVGWNAREWQSVGNKALNAILQVFRTKKNVLLITLPDQFLIDKVPRRLVHYYMEMDQSIHDRGISLGKFFRVLSKPRESKAFHTFLKDDKNRYEKHKFTMNIPQELLDWYEPRRDRATDIVMDKQIQMVIEDSARHSETKYGDTDRESIIVNTVENIHRETGDPYKRCCKFVGISDTAFFYMRKKLKGEIRGV